MLKHLRPAVVGIKADTLRSTEEVRHLDFIVILFFLQKSEWKKNVNLNLNSKFRERGQNSDFWKSQVRVFIIITSKDFRGSSETYWYDRMWSDKKSLDLKKRLFLSDFLYAVEAVCVVHHKNLFTNSLAHTCTHAESEMIPLSVFHMTKQDLKRAAVQQHHQHLWTGTALNAFSLWLMECLSEGFSNIICDVISKGMFSLTTPVFMHNGSLLFGGFFFPSVH